MPSQKVGATHAPVMPMNCLPTAARSDHLSEASCAGFMMERGASLSTSISMPWSVVNSRADFMAQPSRLTVSRKTAAGSEAFFQGCLAPA
eukprot:3765598-Heterocapsa_arctica.AAC.1